MARGLIGILGLILILSPICDSAAGDTKAALGLIASECVSCHEVPGFHSPYGKASVAAPSFQVIANTPQIYTDERLRTFLRRPHFPMTKYILSSWDIDNLIAFLDSLRKK
jgi:hypothetical protein